MRKYIITTLACSALVLVVAGCGSAAATAGNGANPTTVSAEAKASQEQAVVEAVQTTQQTAPAATDIGEAKAKQIALDHAGLKEGEVTFVISRPDYDDGRHMYDVEFYKNLTEYDYEIDAYTGEIISFDQDAEGHAAQTAAAQTAAAQTGANNGANGAAITLDAAKAKALEKAGIAENNATFTDAHLEYDDGRQVYQIDFVSGNMEYEFEIDAVNGSIIEFNSESVYD